MSILSIPMDLVLRMEDDGLLESAECSRCSGTGTEYHLEDLDPHDCMLCQGQGRTWKLKDEEG